MSEHIEELKQIAARIMEIGGKIPITEDSPDELYEFTGHLLQARSSLEHFIAEAERKPKYQMFFV
ncbi:hypothetical protein [Pelagibacterium lacus]|uniref:Uncharacterized protein n=1 Tax=Pelagibacterium lacus TaxID=2282655 RepID=A0A369W6N9_9HYPH|nr:hypothetical protein [Pelagibacterium lacus]RDE10354.1 hypothetical protein DVH29_02915 [Pelagibacterium lacus]